MEDLKRKNISFKGVTKGGLKEGRRKGRRKNEEEGRKKKMGKKKEGRLFQVIKAAH